MKKILLILIAFLVIIPAFGETAKDQEYYKKRLRENFYFAGCTPIGFAGERKGLVTAIDQERVDIVNWIMLAGYNPNDCTFGKTTTAHLAIGKKNEEILGILLDYGVDPNSHGISDTLLTFAIFNKCPECVKVLIDHNVNVNDKLRILPINYAIKKKQPEIVEMLLKAGAKPDEKTLELVNKSKNPEIKALFE